MHLENDTTQTQCQTTDVVYDVNNCGIMFKTKAFLIDQLTSPS